MDTVFKASMQNNIQDMKQLVKNLNQFLHTHQISGRLLNTVNLALEEPLANIINHGGNQDSGVTIDVEVRLNTEDIVILLTDDGKAFNPLSIPHFDIRKPAINRPVGGLGMHILRNIMQTMWYEYKDGKNMLEIQIDR